MSGTGLAPFSATATGNTVTGVVPVRPSTTTTFCRRRTSATHNFRERPVLDHSGVKITIIDATPSELTYSLEQEH
jgi:hypothetical protein